MRWPLEAPEEEPPVPVQQDAGCVPRLRKKTVLSNHTVYPSNGYQRIRGVKINPITGLNRPSGFKEVEAPRFQDIRHKKVVRLSALRSGRLYFPRNSPGTHFC